MAKPMPGAFGPSSDSRQAVVAAAAEHGALRAQFAMGELEGGARVVVETAHHALIDGVGHADRVEHGAHGGKVLRGKPRRDTR